MNKVITISKSSLNKSNLNIKREKTSIIVLHTTKKRNKNKNTKFSLNKNITN
jgi:hypothetical protein